MNKLQQFWTLLRFQIRALTIGIFIAYPLLISMTYWIFLHNTPIILAHDLGWLLSGNSWFFVPLIGSVLLAPELYLFGSAIFTQDSGTEFLLTRAVDRPLLLRVRSILFYGLVLVIPCILFLGTLKSPQLQLKEFDQRISHLILSQIPGSIAVSNNPESTPTQTKADQRSAMITLPHGYVLIGSWRLWSFLCTAIATQIFLFLICSLRYQKFLFWVGCLALMFGPLQILSPTRNEILWFYFYHSNEILFIHFASHQLLCWLIAITALILAQLWCESRFSRMEQ